MSGRPGHAALSLTAAGGGRLVSKPLHTHLKRHHSQNQSIPTQTLVGRRPFRNPHEAVAPMTGRCVGGKRHSNLPTFRLLSRDGRQTVAEHQEPHSLLEGGGWRRYRSPSSGRTCRLPFPSVSLCNPALKSKPLQQRFKSAGAFHLKPLAVWILCQIRAGSGLVASCRRLNAKAVILGKFIVR